MALTYSENRHRGAGLKTTIPLNRITNCIVHWLITSLNLPGTSASLDHKSILTLRLHHHIPAHLPSSLVWEGVDRPGRQNISCSVVNDNAWYYDTWIASTHGLLPCASLDHCAPTQLPPNHCEPPIGSCMLERCGLTCAAFLWPAESSQPEAPSECARERLHFMRGLFFIQVVSRRRTKIGWAFKSQRC